MYNYSLSELARATNDKRSEKIINEHGFIFIVCWMPIFKTKTTNVGHQSVMNKKDNKCKICGIGDSRFLKKLLRKTH